ncbi:hypothetical protein LSH36_1126g00046 [Paralvinella palmiformis]|uniref:G-protein coupled receptors family 1 profile domain-containing protein n=1 Tax=Paralvinella palmiformis TaxID=53620 RepID=A0AAD9MQ44_9ANNE|nr:hypothetical protein LSH36_1126g00046 [Paralvinella palmiformis]
MALNITVTLRTLLVDETNVTDNINQVLLPTRSTLAVGLSSLIVGSICLVTILGNTAVIYAIVNTNQLKDKVSNIFLVNLSITDLSNAFCIMLSALFCISLDLDRVNTIWCNFLCIMNYCLIIVSMMTLALISIDRLLSVLYPFKYHDIVTKGRVVTVIVFTWIQGFIFGIAPACQGWVHYDYWEAICAINWHQEPRSGPINYVIAAFALCFVLPAIVMSISYTVTIRYARMSFKNIIRSSASCSKSGENRVCRKHNNDDNLGLKTITSMLVVVAAFFVCLTPFSVTKLIKVLASDTYYVPPYVNLWAAFFGYLSSMVNPFIYGILRPDFRRAYKKMFHRMMGRRSYHFDKTTTRLSLSGNNNSKQKRCDYSRSSPTRSQSSD